jgi:hypothetical protein
MRAAISPLHSPSRKVKPRVAIPQTGRSRALPLAPSASPVYSGSNDSTPTEYECQSLAIVLSRKGHCCPYLRPSASTRHSSLPAWLGVPGRSSRWAPKTTRSCFLEPTRISSLLCCCFSAGQIPQTVTTAAMSMLAQADTDRLLAAFRTLTGWSVHETCLYYC